VRAEDHLQASVCRFLSAVLPEDAWYCAIPNGFNKTKAAAGIAKATGLKAGAPDLLVVHGGRPIFIELKTAKGRLSPAQKETAIDIDLAGGLWSVCRSIDDVSGFLALCDVPLRGRVAA